MQFSKHVLTISAVSTFLFIPPSFAKSAVGPGEHLEVEVLSRESLQNFPYQFIRTAISAKFSRPDGSVGKYKTLLLIFQPLDTEACNGMGVVEPIHPQGALGYFQGLTQGEIAPISFPHDLAEAIPFLFDPTGRGGYAAAVPLVEKDLLESTIAANFEYDGARLNPSYRIERETDRDYILRDVSLVLRHPEQFISEDAEDEAKLASCQVEKVIAVGYSFTSQVLRWFYFNRQNTALAGASPLFPEHQVFDVSIHAGIVVNFCTDVENNRYLCSGATPVDQGKVMTLVDERDLQFGIFRDANEDPILSNDGKLIYVSAFGVRGQAAHYRDFELAAAPHIPKWIIDQTARRQEAGQPLQNYLDYRYFFRAALEQAKEWAVDDHPPQPSTFIQGFVNQLVINGIAQPVFFSAATIPFPPVFLFDFLNLLTGTVNPDFDFNSDGGIQSVQFRRHGVGGPLGLYRGFECGNFNLLRNPTFCPNLSNPDLRTEFFDYGSFIPYTLAASLGEFNLPYIQLPNPCAVHYPSFAAYQTAVDGAAAESVAKREMLPEDVEGILQQAETDALETFPGCVPNP